MIASGTFGWDGYGNGLPSELPIGKIGAIVAKTTTPKKRLGNPAPRITYGQGWTLNSIGLENPGIDIVIKEYAPIWSHWNIPVILSIASEYQEGFSEIAAAADGTPGIAALELNVSCPNVEGGLEFGQNPDLTQQVTQSVRDNTSLPVIVKLSPNVTDITAIAHAASLGGADALTLTNTLRGMALDPKTKRSSLGTMSGGLSGPALKPVALNMVHRVYQDVSIPIIGAGGISTFQDALEYFLAGATAVQIGTANFADPWTPIHILSQLQSYLEQNKIPSVQSLVGTTNFENLPKPDMSKEFLT